MNTKKYDYYRIYFHMCLSTFDKMNTYRKSLTLNLLMYKRCMCVSFNYLKKKFN